MTDVTYIDIHHPPTPTQHIVQLCEQIGIAKHLLLASSPSELTELGPPCTHHTVVGWLPVISDQHTDGVLK